MKHPKITSCTGIYQQQDNGTVKRLNQRKRNDPCNCGSGKKWKKCCALTMYTVGEMVHDENIAARKANEEMEAAALLDDMAKMAAKAIEKGENKQDATT